MEINHFKSQRYLHQYSWTSIGRVQQARPLHRSRPRANRNKPAFIDGHAVALWLCAPAESGGAAVDAAMFPGQGASHG